MQVTLPPHIVAMARVVAHERATGGYSTPLGDHTATSAHYAGVCGELAFAELCGGRVNIEVGAEGSHGYTDVIAGGVRFEIKTVVRGDLALVFNHAPVAGENDCYVLCAYKGDHTVEFVGCAPEADVLDITKAVIRNYGHGERYVLPIQYLRPIEDALAMAGVEGFRHETLAD